MRLVFPHPAKPRLSDQLQRSGDRNNYGSQCRREHRINGKQWKGTSVTQDVGSLVRPSSHLAGATGVPASAAVLTNRKHPLRLGDAL